METTLKDTQKELEKEKKEKSVLEATLKEVFFSIIAVRFLLFYFNFALF